MLYHRSAQLALQAALWLALKPEGTSYRVREIAAGLGVPATYLAKVLQSLTRSGLLRGVRGPGGGVQLARPAREMRLWDVLMTLEPVSEFERCFLGQGQCNDLHPCPLHEAWGPIRSQILEMLQGKSLWEYASEGKTLGLRVRDTAARPARALRPPRTGGSR